jgi:dihydropteroate synthase
MIAPRAAFTLTLPGRRPPLVLGPQTLVMGVLNVTPDSFSDGGQALDPDRALDHALAMEAAGAHLIDVGAESTRPGAATLTVREERARLMPVLRRLHPLRIPLSIDTTKAEVARFALDEGVSVLNDISGLQYDPGVGDIAAVRGAPLILMHMRGRPADMYAHARYDDVAGDVARDLTRAIERAVSRGVPWEQIVVDPGLGFAKRAEHSAAALAGVEGLAALGRPVLVGPSRKSFLAEAAGGAPAAARDWPTAAAVTAAVLAGAHIVRVHAVPEMVQVVRAADMIRDQRPATGAGR